MRVPTRSPATARPRTISGVRHSRSPYAAMPPERRSSPPKPQSFFPMEPFWNTVQLPGIRAAIELHRGQPARAVELLASASPYERAYPEAVYLRGMAYLRLRKGAEAAAEFQKILDHKGASWASTWRFPNWGLLLFAVLPGTRARLRTRRRPGEGQESPFKTSSPFGRTLTLTSPSCNKPRQNTPGCHKLHSY